MGDANGPEAALGVCCLPNVSKGSPSPAPAPRKSPRPPHLRRVPHRPLSAPLAPGSLRQPPPGLPGAGSGVPCEIKLRVRRPSPGGGARKRAGPRQQVAPPGTWDLGTLHLAGSILLSTSDLNMHVYRYTRSYTPHAQTHRKTEKENRKKTVTTKIPKASRVSPTASF